jgi:signal transduction histidine kinase
VGVLIEKFNNMEDQLAVREAELEHKNLELMQTKKLAAIGTLAAGVAHELNNPLNNIYLSTQVLAREVKDNCPPEMKEVFNDILSQTIRVKKIVGDLLEFARVRAALSGYRTGWPDPRPLQTPAERRGEVACTLTSDQQEVLVWADQDRWSRSSSISSRTPWKPAGRENCTWKFFQTIL